MDNKFDTEYFFDKVFETRNFEIGLFWRRSNYFLFLNVSIAAGLFSTSNDSIFLPILLSLIGFISCVFWYKVNLGSKYWQSKWEEELADFEKTVTKGTSIGQDLKELKFFNIEREYSDQLVEKSLQKNNKSYGWLRKKINKGVLKKPSVSYQMILLSLVFIVFWFIVFLFYLMNLTFFREIVRCIKIQFT